MILRREERKRLKTVNKKSNENKNTVTVYFRRISAVYIGVMFSVFLLYFDGSGFGGITEAKYYFFRYVSLAYLIACLLLGVELLCVGAVKPREVAARLRHPGWIRICMLGYVFFCTVSALRSPYGKSTWIGMGRYEGLSTILLYVGVFLFISYFAEFEEWMVGIAGAAMTAMACLCLVQFTGANPFGIYPGDYHYDSVFLGTIGNIDMIGTIFSILLPLFLATIVVRDDRRRYLLLIPVFLCAIIWCAIRVEAALLAVAAVCVLLIPVACLTAKRLSDLLIGYAAIAVGCSVSELFTLDRANEFGYSMINPGTGFIVTLAGAVLCLALSVLIRKKLPETRIHPERVRIAFAGVIVVAAAGAFIWLKWFCPVTEGTLYELSRFVNGDSDVTFGNNRFLIWSETLKLVKEYPLFGAGPDTLGSRLTVDVVLDASVSTEVETAVVDNAHNEYLNILVNTGLFSLISYLGGLVLLAAFWLKRAMQNRKAAILGAAAAGYCIQAFFSFSITMTTPLFWIVLGLLCALEDTEHTNRVRNEV
ncbi:MAG: O-antigen ligase family protein [Lachnospiraceae bacterium]|nr:O-antigen ligase family protein [Lachnospiraceae bacterium]